MLPHKHPTIMTFFIFPVLVLLLNFVAVLIGLYDLFFLTGEIMHFLGGISIAYMCVLFLRFFKKENIVSFRGKFLVVFIIVSVVSLFAVFWEFLEFLSDNFLGTSNQLGLEDTLLDLFMGILGGFLFSVFRGE